MKSINRPILICLVLFLTAGCIANVKVDLSDGVSAQEALSIVEEHYASQGAGMIFNNVRLDVSDSGSGDYWIVEKWSISSFKYVGPEIHVYKASGTLILNEALFF